VVVDHDSDGADGDGDRRHPDQDGPSVSIGSRSRLGKQLLDGFVTAGVASNEKTTIGIVRQVSASGRLTTNGQTHSVGDGQRR
jgi:hypothetical protein